MHVRQTPARVTKRKGTAVLAHSMKAFGVDVRYHSFLTSSLDAGEWSASNYGRCTPCYL